MTTRRSFLSALACLPVIGRLFARKSETHVGWDTAAGPDESAVAVHAVDDFPNFQYIPRDRPYVVWNGDYPQPGDIVTVEGWKGEWLVGRDGVWVKRG